MENHPDRQTDSAARYVRFHRFALFTTAATYFLVFVGGLVRVSGAGMGCPDWPKCFGRWIPPTNVNQLPEHIDPAQFNFVLAWIEYGNRIVGMTVGLLIAALGIWAIVKFRKQPRLLWPSIAAAFLVAFQGWQGSVVVSSLLAPYVITLHMLLALLLVCLLIYITQHAYYLRCNHTAAIIQENQSSKMMLIILWLLAFIQVAFGTQLRGKLEILSDQFPLWSNAERLSALGWMNNLHVLFGVAMAFLAIVVAVRLSKAVVQSDQLVRPAIISLVALMILELIIGVLFIVAEIPALLQLFHLWVASLMIGCLLILYIAVSRKESR
jgi:cytochrome c oxidase assembly protein subunit 15